MKALELFTLLPTNVKLHPLQREQTYKEAFFNRVFLLSEQPMRSGCITKHHTTGSRRMIGQLSPGHLPSFDIPKGLESS